MFQGHPGVTTGAMTPPTIDSPPCSSGGEGSSLSGGGIINYALNRSVEKNIFQKPTLITPLSFHLSQTISTSIPQPLRAVAQVLGNYLNVSLESLLCASSVASLGGRQLLIALSDNVVIYFLSVRTWLSVSVADARFLMM